ncbi:hypothetical protein ACIPK7_15885 [Pseudomonas sp. NPDC086581]|uniref:hypothetical protein n=1 Tax=Pseudomonas sp. NPDC086581 TaxID=3364432 RepID=UPI0038309BAB
MTEQSLKSWSHPLGDSSNPLVQLTNLADAAGGYYPLGRNGFWHGGIHFDVGTDGKTDPSHVRCIADGEVVAYRIDSEYPQSTFYNASNEAFQAPFATGFVLVRHRLQAPAIAGSEAAPPELIFYSLYMHLQHWAAYRDDDSIARPAFWPEGAELRVKQTVNDTRAGRRGLNVRSRANHNSAHPAPVIDLLERGSKVTVSGEGTFRKLEGTRGPAWLMGEEGALRGYLSFQHLELIAGDLYRVKTTLLNVRAEPNSSAGTAIIGKLPKGAEVTVSGEGDFRKLESVNQYVHFGSLEGQPEPQARDAVVVPAAPAAIKAGALIGHIGDTQDAKDTRPQRRLHLEVFSGQNVQTFINNSRDWAKDLPASGKTWLKFAKGTTVIAHQDSFSASHPPSPTAAGTPTGTDLILPKSLLSGLRAEYKIQVPATSSEKARNWYRLEGLFNSAEFASLDGWVCEEVGVTPWVNPWAWEGFELIYNDSTPREELAYSMCAAQELNDEQLVRYQPWIEQATKGPLHKRLHDLVPDGTDGMLTSDELQAGLHLPAVAQSVSRLIIHYESEWFGGSQKWDPLDDLLGHSGSTPNPNWVASKERMGKLGWWSDVAPGLGLPGSGEVYHFHPIGLTVRFDKQDACACGCCLGKVFSRYRWVRVRANHPDTTYYGPVYHGTKKLDSFSGWADLVAAGKATDDERQIVIAMSSNEGALDAVQAWDWQTLSAGAMQKTVTPEGFGELPQQIYEFKDENPDLYDDLFSQCGWTVEKENGKSRIYYSSPETGGRNITGEELYNFIKLGFQQADSGFPKESKPLASIAHAILNDSFQSKQVVDFIGRMHTALRKKPVGYSHAASDFFKSRLGRALVLDHDVNAPGNVVGDLKRAVDRLRQQHPGLSGDPNAWGANRTQYENELVAIYGPARHMHHAQERYNHLRGLL